MSRPLRVASLLAVVAAGGAAWFFLAPVEIGGRSSYAVVYGSSMEPHLHRGDLVVLRRRNSYRRGDVVAYHSLQLRRNVLHRIVGGNDTRFAFKGDNNDFLDPEKPLRNQLFGGEWVVVPHAGAVLEHLRSPRYAAVVAALIVLLLVGAGPGGGVRRHRRGTSSPAPAVPGARSGGTAAVAALGVAGAAVLAAGASLAVVSLRQPLERAVAHPGVYVQRGAFSWSAAAPVGAVYRTSTLGPSDPVFLKLVRRLDVRFTYRVRSARVASFSGSGSLAAVLSDGNGWQRTFALTGRRQLRDGRLTLPAALDLRKIAAAVHAFEAQTGVQSTVYHLFLAPTVTLRGVAGAHPVRETFAPRIAFDLDDLRLRIAHPPTPNTLVRTKAVAGVDKEPSSIQLFGRRTEVAAARRLSLLLGAAGLGGVIAAATLLLLRRRDGEVDAIERRYGDLIVRIDGREWPSAPERRVATMEALVRIAERYDRLILHEQRAGLHSFLVEDAGVVFRYAVGPEAGGLSLEDAPHARAVQMET